MFTGRSPTMIRASAVTVTVIRSSGCLSGRFATGRDTSIPRLIIGAVTMKTSRSTSTTSTRGVTLISPIIDPLRRPRNPW